MTRPICGSSNCLTCVETVTRLTTPRRAVDPTTVLPGAEPPTARSLKRHMERYGTEFVGLVAQQYGIRLDVPNETKEKKPRGPSLQKRIESHLERGVSWTGIAELENLSPRRARELRAKFEAKVA